MKKIISVVGARPNFMKVAPLHRAFLKQKDKIQHLICHTGQHYDENMSKIFFEDLELPKPDFYLGVGSGSHAEQTAEVMIEFEKILHKEKPDLVVVVGDVNSTIACSLTAAKLHIKIAHVEAGLRSFDREMPEEINRVLTDQISDYLFVTERSGLENLINEGISEEKVFFTGNVMIDSLVYFLEKAAASDALKKFDLLDSNYVLVTLHRPSNVDSEKQLQSIVNMLNSVSQKRKIIFPIHPRTKKNLELYSLINKLNSDVILSEPIGYLDFLSLLRNTGLVITDSGGIQEETTYLGIQCITVRKTTERPITVEKGTNHLVGDDFRMAEKTATEILNGRLKNGQIPDLWDGNAADKISEIIIAKL
ncbi:MAG: UDP-N-acetylglucosamine 2-epimerase (non-hydrolyzing) [Ignavibacteria bacterium]|nr:UDP-N-acetylglucosamine 2-epimerase (non-hydrolyzing) [Ignavibacteria bacterium]NNL20098.1 UDP-N-acetylglucosamine 2-epimerase (non-hydrolyzing) [Ignavibacteriaceae bacterium]